MAGSAEVARKNVLARGWRYLVRSKTVAPSLLLMYALMVIVFASLSREYISLINFKAIMSDLAVSGIVSVGMMVVILAGGLDLSVGSIVGLSGVILARFFNIPGKTFPLWMIYLAGIAVGLAFGAINGALITRVGINPVITTLGTMAVGRGLCYIWATQVARIFDPIYLNATRVFVFNLLPISLLYMLFVMILMWFILKYTRFGRNIYAVGGNPVAARLAGINVRDVQFSAYVISGLMCAIAAIILTGNLGMGRPEFGTGLELDVITIVLLGGVSLAGGKGDMLSLLIAVLIMGSIGNGLVLLDVPIYWRQVVRGFILIIAVAIDLIRYRKRV